MHGRIPSHASSALDAFPAESKANATCDACPAMPESGMHAPQRPRGRCAANRRGPRSQQRLALQTEGALLRVKSMKG